MEKSVNSLKSSFSALSAVVTTAVQVVKTVVSTAVNLVVGIVRKGISLIKKLVTSAFNFIKSALSTLLSWTTKALGKVFDGIGNLINKSAQTAVKAGKAAVRTIVNSLQAYADKQYNSIQLQVSLGDDFDQVNRDFQELLRYTTADKNDLWSVMATYAEMGKTAKDITRYTRATIYLANATGKSLDSITRMLLTQEALSRDVEKTLKKYGVNISGLKDDISTIDKIITKMGPEMEALANESLAQSFANVKNDLISAQEKLGSLFAGPVKYIVDKADDLLKRLLGKDMTQWAERINSLFDSLKDKIDDIFEFFGKVLNDPAGFLKALGKDIKQLLSNFWKNLGYYLGLLGKTIGVAIGYLVEWLKTTDFASVKTAMTHLGDALESFVLNFGSGLGLWTDEDIKAAEGSLYGTFVNAWNRAHPDFTLSTEDKWYKNLGTMLDFAWENAVKPAWDWIKTKCLPGIKDWWMNKAVPVLKTTFEWLGEVLSSAFTNLLLQSETLRTIMSAIGMPIATTQDQKSSYEAFKQWLPKTARHGNVWDDFGPSDLTSEFLKSKYTGDDWFTGTWGQYLETVSKKTGEELNILRRISRADSITETSYVPNFRDLMDRIDEALNPVKTATEDTTKTLNEIPEMTGIQLKPIAKSVETIEETVTKGMKVAASGGSVALPFWTTGGGGGGGIQDYFATSNEFKIKPYAEGGTVTSPTLALIGEAGPEAIVPLSRTTGGGGINVIEGWKLNSEGKWVTEFQYELEKIWENAGKPLVEGVNNISEWCENAAALPQVTKDIESYCKSDDTFLDRLWKGIKNVFSKDWWKNVIEEAGYFLNDTWNEVVKIWNLFKGITWDDIKHLMSGAVEGIGKAVSKTVSGVGKAAGWLVQNGALGSHIGNIASGIMQQQENGTLSIWTAIGEVIKEFLPYLQKGLEVVGGIFDEAFEIAGNAVMHLGEEIGQTLLPLLEAFVPFMKTLSDVIIALAPVVSSILSPAIKVIALILNIITGLLDKLMPVIAGLSAVIQWVSDAISWAIGSFINWLASWVPWVQTTSVSKPKAIKDYYWDIMNSYNESKANSATGISTATAVGTAGQTASYSGATTIHIHNDFNGSYIVGAGGMKELALIIRNTLQDIDYTGQTV